MGLLLRFCYVAFVAVNLPADVHAAPSTDQFMNALSTCAVNLRIEIRGDLVGSIRSIYEGASTRGQLVFQQSSDFLNLFPAADRLHAYELYTICVRSALDTSGFDPFILSKIIVGKTSIEYAKQRLGLPSEDDDNLAKFIVGGYLFKIYYLKDGLKSTNGPAFEVKPGTVEAISIALSGEGGRPKPLVLDGYWVPFGCEKDDHDCGTWGTRKPLGSVAMKEFTGSGGGGCHPVQTGDAVGFNQEPNRILYFCGGFAANKFLNAAFSCSIGDGNGPLKIPSAIGHLKYYEEQLRDANDNPAYAADVREILKNLRTEYQINRSKYEELFKTNTDRCLVDEYAIFGSDYDSGVLFEGGFDIQFGTN
jgi:hypothetical protein